MATVANRSRHKRIKKVYGITMRDTTRMMREQDSKCAICGAPLGSTWHVDHDHKTGKVRGLLCMKCNTGLGKLGDNIRGLNKALKYLQAHKKKTRE